MKTKFLAALLPLFLFAVPAHAAAASDRLIDPTASVGAITASSTDADIIRIYGAANVVQSGDGKSLTLFPGGPDELRISFHKPHELPERVAIVGSNATWAFANGLKVGISVDELEKLNGGPFDVTGLNYEIPARVVSWKGGAFPPTMYVDLAPTDHSAADAHKRLASNKTFFESSNPALRNFIVRRIVLEW